MKKVLAMLLTAVMTISLTACGGSSSGQEAAQNSGGELSGTVVVWSWDQALAHLKEQAEGFKELHPQVEFQFEEMATNQVYQKMTTSLQTGIGLPDIVSFEGEQMAKFGEKFPGQFVDFTDVVPKDDFLPIKVAECTVDGKLVAYPWDSAPCALFYRKDMFEAAGIKAEEIVTWDDFIEAGKVMKEATGADIFCMAESTSDLLYRLILMEQGSFYFDSEGKTQVNSEASQKAMEICKKLYDADITFNNSSWNDMAAGMSADKFASFADAVWMVGAVKDTCPDQEGKWAVMELPRVDAEKEALGSSNGGSVLTIPAASKNAEAAKAFIQYAMEDIDANIRGFQNYGIYPAYLPALESEEFLEPDTYYGGQKIFEVFEASGKKVPDVNYTGNFAEAIELSKNCYARIILEDADIAESLKEEQNEMEAKFGK